MEQTTRADFAEFILNMRTAAGLTRKGLAELIGVQESDITLFEKERIRPTECLYQQIRQVVRNEIARRRESKRNAWIIITR